MSVVKYINRLERIHSLVRRGGTGTPKELASRLNIAESTLYQYVQALRELGAPITYDTFRQSYVYYQPCTLSLKYQLTLSQPNQPGSPRANHST